MTTPAIETTFEVLPPDVTTASTELAAPSDKVMMLFKPFEKPFESAAALLAEEENATTADTARALRLKMVKARTAITATKDESKSDIKLAGNIIDWFHNKGRDRLASSEARLMEIEKAEERAEAARIEAIRAERVRILDELGHVHTGMNFGPMTEENWQVYLQQAKDLAELRLAREKKAREDAEAAAKKEAEEREAQRLENIRLKEEAEAREKAMQAEREAAEKALAEERRIAAEKEAAAAEERRRFEEIAEKARKAATAELVKEQAEKARIEAEAKALRDAEAKRIADEKAKQEAQAKAEAAAAKKAAAAPDKEKLMEFANKVRALVVPLAKSEDGRAVAAEINQKVESFAKWIETQAATL